MTHVTPHFAVVVSSIPPGSARVSYPVKGQAAARLPLTV
jgi:hypothetical protein